MKKYIFHTAVQDDTLVGWKEDFNLSFMTNIPAQSEALKYIRRVSKKYNSKIHLGGHSKGVI